MKYLMATAVLLSLSAAAGLTAAARIGEPAPAFSNVDVAGKRQSLADFKGRWVVLEWHNPGCGFTQKHYTTGNLPKLQKEWTAKGVVWLAIASPSVKPERAASLTSAHQGGQTALLLDPEGATAQAFEAKTSPQMIVIDPKGMVAYNGAIDDKPTMDVADVPGAKNYVAAALSEGLAGKPISVPSSRPYGCAVKYSAGSE